MIRTILIKPDLNTETKESQFAYQDFCEIHQQKILGSESVDLKLPDGSYLHTVQTEKGMFITIHKKI